jgi:predicted GNAT family acetyltransferase
MSEQTRLTVRNNQAAGQYELTDGQAVLALAQYQPSEGAVAFVHTEVTPALEGRGLGGVLVKAALDDIESRGGSVLPYCTFVRHFIQTHPEYLHLVPQPRRAAFGLPENDSGGQEGHEGQAGQADRVDQVDRAGQAEPEGSQAD